MTVVTNEIITAAIFNNKIEAIATDTEYEIGTGGDYADLQTALDALTYYRMVDGAVITLKLIAGFSPVNVVQNHPQGEQIVIDFNGQDYEVTTGTAFYAVNRKYLSFTNTGADMIVSTLDNGTGVGFFANNGGQINISSSTVASIGVGKSSYGFSVGIYSNNSSYIYARKVSAEYSATYGFQGRIGSTIDAKDSYVANNTTNGYISSDGSTVVRDGATGAQATGTSPAVGVIGNNNSIVI